MIMKVIVVLLVLCLAEGQNFQGGLLDNLYTDRLTIYPQKITGIQSFSYPLARSDVFTSAQQEFFIAAGLIDFGIGSIDTDPNNMMNFQIRNEKCEAGLTFKFDLDYDSYVINRRYPDTPAVKIEHLSYSIMIVGELFSGDSTATQSSFIWGRIGKVQEITTERILFDFANPDQGLKSPFAWNQIASAQRYCGAVKLDEQWVVDNNCDHIGAVILVSGIQQGIVVSDQLFTILNGVEQSVINLKTAELVYSENPSADGLTLDFQSSDSTIKYIQLSIVVIAIREYSFTQSYPGDQFYKDDFIASFTPGIIDNDGIDGSKDILVGQLNTAGGGTDTIDNAYLYFPHNAKYDNPDNVGHIYCGITNVYFFENDDDTLGPIDGVASFFLKDINLAQSTWDYSIPPILDASGNNINTLEDIIDITLGHELELTCLMLTNRNPCLESTLFPPVINSIGSYSMALEPLSTTNTAEFGGTFTSATTDSYQNLKTDSSYIDFSGNIINMQLKLQEKGKVLIKFNYKDIKKDKGYEGVLHLFFTSPPSADPKDDSGLTYNKIIKIQFLGEIIYYEKTKLSVSPQTIHFSLYNSQGSSSGEIGETLITIETDYNQNKISKNPILQLNMQYGLLQHSKFISDEKQCVSSCVERSGFSIGINYNNVPPNCVYCDKEFMLSFQNDEGACGCMQSYQSVKGLCQLCEMDLCYSCATDLKSQCYLCVENATFVDENNRSKGCQCVTGFYKDELICKPCPQGCVSCINSVTCVECVQSQGTRLTPTETCVCKPGYYQSTPFTAKCQQCSLQCANCSQSSTNCTNCSAEKNFQSNGTTCTCISGYTLTVNTTSKEGICRKCDQSCKSCQTFFPNKCEECAEFRTNAGDGVCQCIEGYVEYDGKCIDGACSGIQDCQNCQVVLGTGKTICQKCASEQRILSADNSTCQCRVGYYDQDKQCLSCGTGCQKCSSPSSCIQCAQGSIPQPNGTCLCPKGFYIQTQQTLNILLCDQCDRTCGTCSRQANNCTSCLTPDFILANNTCTCKQSMYPSLDRRQCLNCSQGCLSCSSLSKCDICKSGYFSSSSTSNGSQCILQCVVGAYENAGECKQCSDNCRSCTGAISCRSCLTGFNLYAGVCRDKCPDGTVSMNAICFACAPPCKNCVRSQSNCTSCVDGFTFYNGQCIQSCPSGFYLAEQTCKKCSAQCRQCLNLPDYCMSCFTGKFLSSGKCVDTCPSLLTVDGQCLSGCLSGYFIENNQCVKCEGLCKTCTSRTFCSSCVGNLKAYRGSCPATCPNTTIPVGNNTACADCHVSCQGCASSPLQCIQCAAGYFRWLKNCVKECPEGTYLNATIRSCLSCDSGCKKCVQNGQCLECYEGTVDANGRCQDNDCGKNCLACENGQCNKCALGFVSNGKECINFCPANSNVENGICRCSEGFFLDFSGQSCLRQCQNGYFGIDRRCQRCFQPCGNCVDTPNTCTSCINDQFTFDPVTSTCTLTPKQCPYGRALHFKTGSCVFLCPQNNYFLDLACMRDSCPTGYITDTQNRACLKQTPSKTGCSIPLYLQGTRCVEQCFVGFFADETTRICQPCSSNCYQCESSERCVFCDRFYDEKNGVCVEDSGCPDQTPFRVEGRCVIQCPVGYFGDNQSKTCLPICQASTFYDSGRCYERCRTGSLRTPVACVQSCPGGYLQNGDLCQPIVFASSRAATTTNSVKNKQCISGQYFNPSTKLCSPCPKKCAACQNQQTCLACSHGFINNGADCIRNLYIMKPVHMQVTDVTREGVDKIFITLKLNAFPFHLPKNLVSKSILFFLQNQQYYTDGNRPYITVWRVKDDSSILNCVINFPAQRIPNTAMYLLLNNDVLGPLYQNMGFSTANTFAYVQISSQSIKKSLKIPKIPLTASKSQPLSKEVLTSNSVYNMALNSVVSKALKLD